jgi:ABC-type multidrug transport system permease subunit
MSHHHTEGLPYCQNCHYPIAEFDKFCPNCGQKNTDGRVSLHDLWHELMHYFTHVDNQIFVTIRHVFVPGKLTDAFFRGHRKRYIHPINLFFVIGIILPFILSQAWKNNLGGEDEIDKGYIQGKSVYRNDLLFEMDSMIKQDSNHYSGNLKIEFDTFLLNHYRRSNNFHPLPLIMTKKNKNFIQRDSLNSGVEINGQRVKMDELDINHLSETALFEKYHITRYQDKLHIKQLIQMSKYGIKPLITGFTSKFIWITIFSIIPTAAFMLLLYRQQKRLYVEHLVFLMHYSCFLFIIYTALMFNKGWLIMVSMLVAFLFLIFAVKRFYQQNWGLTLIKSVLCYLFYLTIGFFLSGIAFYLSTLM